MTYKNRSLINAGFIYSPVAARIPDSGITILEDNSTTNYIPTLLESPRQPSMSLKSNFNVSLYDFTEAISVEAKSSLSFYISSSDNNNNTLTIVCNVTNSGRADGAFFSRSFTNVPYSDGNYLVFHSPSEVVLSSTSSTNPVNPVNPDPVVSCTLVSEGYQYNTSSYNGICYTNENWRTIYSDGIIYNGQIEYGAYIRHIPPYTELPSG
ncbi:MAG: hypothetical protein JNM71_06875 [Flavobacterium lindanitolerans]|uniref:hypothetical protein n=1 Tax=Flavobacterium lindanitolerans TaxID=428988 RepID=UPI001A415DD5|nr:hypothetical protein [Flavobacterium lindanitolerans]MBL7867726.1 hypothetical protein [Flavobacterium lindanitolerans]